MSIDLCDMHFYGSYIHVYLSTLETLLYTYVPATKRGGGGKKVLKKNVMSLIIKKILHNDLVMFISR